MKKSGKCPKCGGTSIIADATVIDRGHGNSEKELKVSTYQRPEAFLFKGPHSTTASAWVCTFCGFVELYADEPRALLLPKEERQP